MEDYIILVFTIIFASLVLALIWLWIHKAPITVAVDNPDGASCEHDDVEEDQEVEETDTEASGYHDEATQNSDITDGGRLAGLYCGGNVSLCHHDSSPEEDRNEREQEDEDCKGGEEQSKDERELNDILLELENDLDGQLAEQACSTGKAPLLDPSKKSYWDGDNDDANESGIFELEDSSLNMASAEGPHVDTVDLLSEDGSHGMPGETGIREQLNASESDIQAEQVQQHMHSPEHVQARGDLDQVQNVESIFPRQEFKEHVSGQYGVIQEMESGIFSIGNLNADLLGLLVSDDNDDSSHDDKCASEDKGKLDSHQGHIEEVITGSSNHSNVDTQNVLENGGSLHQPKIPDLIQETITPISDHQSMDGNICEDEAPSYCFPDLDDSDRSNNPEEETDPQGRQATDSITWDEVHSTVVRVTSTLTQGGQEHTASDSSAPQGQVKTLDAAGAQAAIEEMEKLCIFNNEEVVTESQLNLSDEISPQDPENPNLYCSFLGSNDLIDDLTTEKENEDLPPTKSGQAAIMCDPETCEDKNQSGIETMTAADINFDLENKLQHLPICQGTFSQVKTELQNNSSFSERGNDQPGDSSPVDSGHKLVFIKEITWDTFHFHDPIPDDTGVFHSAGTNNHETDEVFCTDCDVFNPNESIALQIHEQSIKTEEKSPVDLQSDPLSTDKKSLSKGEQFEPLSQSEQSEPLSKEEKSVPLSKEEKSVPLSKEEKSVPLSKVEHSEPLSNDEPYGPASKNEQSKFLSKDVHPGSVSKDGQSELLSKDEQSGHLSKDFIQETEAVVDARNTTSVHDHDFNLSSSSSDNPSGLESGGLSGTVVKVTDSTHLPGDFSSPAVVEDNDSTPVAVISPVTVSSTEKPNGKIEEDVKEEADKSTILAKQKNFNENCCMRCFSRFFFIFNQKVQCYNCQFYVCKNCSDYDREEKEYMCKVCQKQRELQEQTCDWFYGNVKKKFKRFGSAKVVRSLYKRKTDTDSENDSGYHPALYNSEPIGKRSRQSVTGIFDIDINGEPNQKELRGSESTPGGGKTRHDDSDVSMVEEEIIAQRREKKYPRPYSCGVATGDSFSHVQDLEIKEFKKQVEGIITDIHRTLEVQSPDIASQDDANTENLEKVVNNRKLLLSSALSNLAQSLHIAVDNQDPQVDPSTPTSATAKHQLVKQILVREVENFTGHPIDVGDEPTSEYASEDGSQASDSHSQHSYEDILADFMMKKIVEDHHKAQEEIDRREEAALERSLKRLENRANVTQLHDMLSGVSESETDDLNSSAVSRPEDNASDAESKMSGYSELSLTTKDIGGSPLALSSPRDKSWGSCDNNSHQLDLNKNEKNVSNGLDDIDGLTNEERNRIIENEWVVVESKMSPMVSTAPELSRHMIYEDSLYKEIEQGGDGSLKGRASREEVGDSDDTLEGSPLEDSPIKSSQPTRQSPDMLDEDSMLDYTQTRRVPLPSFTDDDRVGLPEVDLDDISRHGGEDEGEPRSPTWDSEITFSSQWKFDSGGLFNDRTISAYDNFGEKKVGLDGGGGPVIMLVPRAGEADGEMVKVGDRDIDEMSELSENDAPSDISLDPSDDEEIVEAAQKITREFSTMTDSSVQTEDVELEVDVEMEAEAVAEAERAARAAAMATDLPPVSSEGEETDPKFVTRPQNVTVLEGEPMNMECEVAGTEPVDVFWYKDTVEVSPLEEDERSEVRRHDNLHSIQVYNTAKADAGQYLCIGVNDLGQCNQSFKVTVQDNPNEKLAPEFIKGLSDMEVVVGQSVKFRCKVKGYPPPRVLWYRDGKRIKNSEQYKIEKYGNRDYVLWLEYASLDDDAEYMVVARNMVGDTKSTCQLVVEASEQALQERVEREDRERIPLTPVPSITTVPDNLYPDTDELLRLAQQVSITRDDVSVTSSKTLRSAQQFSAMNKQLDEMDRRLENLQDEVVDTMNNNNQSPSTYDDGQELQSSAYAVRAVTNSALGVLAEAEIARQESNKTTEIVISRAEGNPDEEEVEISLSFSEFEKLYAAGKISHEQMKTGMIKRKDKKMIEEFLRQDAKWAQQNSFDGSHDIMVDEGDLKVFDCGLKRVDSKRYKRDYVVVKDNGQKTAASNAPKRWEVETAPHPAPEVVRSTPAGTSVDVHAEIAEAEEKGLYDIHEQEEQTPVQQVDTPNTGKEHKEKIYMAAGKVYSLENQVRDLEGEIGSMEEDITPAELALLENKVARAVARVTLTEKQVTDIERTIEDTFDEAPNVPSAWRDALKSKTRRYSEKFDIPTRAESEEDKTDRRKSVPASYLREPKQSESSMQASYLQSESSVPNVNLQHSQSSAPVLNLRESEGSAPVLNLRETESSVTAPYHPQAERRPRGPVTSTPVSNNMSTQPLQARPIRKSSGYVQHHIEQLQHRNITSPEPSDNVFTGDNVSPVSVPAREYTSAPRPEPSRVPVQLSGETEEQALPESRTEYEEDIQLPSVKNLLSKFSHSQPEESPDSSVKRQPETYSRRVYSLTGRDIPRTIREKLKKQGPSIVPNSNVRVDETPRYSSPRRPINSIFENPASQPEASDSHSSVPLAEEKYPYAMTEQVQESPSSQAVPTRTAVYSTGAPVQRSQSFEVKPSVQRSQSFEVQSGNRPPRLQAKSKEEPLRRVSLGAQKKNKSSTILARAAFWDSRITQGTVEDSSLDLEFPEMPEESFKSESEGPL